MGASKRTKLDPKATGNRPGKSSAGMHTCPSCSSVLVQPSSWREQPDGHWLVELHCPECEWWDCDSFSQREVDRYDEELDRGAQELIEDLRALTRANMEEEMERFALALDSGGLLPEDF